MPSKFSFILILAIGAGLLFIAAYFMSDASTSKTIIQESRRLEYEPIEYLRNQDPIEYTSRRWEIDNRYDAQLNIIILHKEAGAWGAGIFGVLLIMLGTIDFRLYRRRCSQRQKGILAKLVEQHIDALLAKRDDVFNAGNAEKWTFEKSIFIENVFSKENTGRLLFNKEEISTMIDQIIDGTLE
ncbi:MAG: hypothetical protein K8S62_10990 [Candidatus Sabulitectum sp.]|nr:hypothetical protein [Candidatus Sabulitectum sp.]